MYIRSQDRNTLINFENFNEICLNREDFEIYAVSYTESSKIRVLLGRYSDLETAEAEYEDILDSLCDENNVAIHEVE